MATVRLAVMTAIACMAVSTTARPVSAADGEFTAGAQWWDQSARDAKFQEFREVPRGAFLESFLLSDALGRTFVDLWGANAIRSDQSTRMRWADGARWRLDLGYSQIPHTFSHLARWGWLQAAPGSFTLPDSLQARNQQLPSSYTQRMSDFLANAPRVGLDFRTNVTSARLRARPSRGWTIETRSRLTKRAGLKPYAMSFGFNTALENPEPIDQRIVDAEVIAGYERERWTARGTLGVSEFDNKIGELRVDNPRRFNDAPSGDGTAVGQLDLYPDNRVLRGTAEMAYRLGAATALSATVGVAQGRQDDDFLPFTINSTLPQSNPDSLPARSLDGKTTQLTGDVRLRTRPWQKLDGTLRFHYEDFDNRTDVLDFIGQTPYESGWQRFAELENHVQSHTRTVSGFDLDYAVMPRLRLGGLAELRTRERTEREVERDDEVVLGARARLRPVEGMTLSAQYTRGDREMDSFNLEHYFGLKTRTAIGSTPGLYDSLGLLEQPGLRRYDVADRVQDRAGAEISYGFDRVDLSATYGFLRNDFGGDTLLGLREEKVHSIATAGTIHWSDRLDLTGGYGLNLTKTDQISRASPATLSFNPDSNWIARLDGEEVFVFGGFDWAPRARWGIGADYQFTRDLTTFDLDNGLGNALDLPTVIYRRHDLLLETRWQWRERTSLIGRWGWEEQDTNDWATTDVPLIFPTTGNANAIFLGDSSLSYRAHRLALLVRHQF